MRFGVWDPQENPGHRPKDRYLATFRDCFRVLTDNVGVAKKKIIIIIIIIIIPCDMVWRATLSCLSYQSNAGYADWSMRAIPTNRVSADHADASSAVGKLAEEMDAVFLRHGVESYALLSLLPVDCVPAYSGRETLHMCDVSHFCFFPLVALAA